MQCWNWPPWWHHCEFYFDAYSIQKRKRNNTDFNLIQMHSLVLLRPWQPSTSSTSSYGTVSAWICIIRRRRREVSSRMFVGEFVTFHPDLYIVITMLFVKFTVNPAELHTHSNGWFTIVNGFKSKRKNRFSRKLIQIDNNFIIASNIKPCRYLNIIYFSNYQSNISIQKYRILIPWM